MTGRKWLTWLMILVMAVTVFAPAVPAEAAAPKLSKTKLTLVKGKTATLKMKNLGKKKVVWGSSKPKVASVNTKGKVTAKKKGTAVITAIVEGSAYTCKVKVTNASKPNAPEETAAQESSTAEPESTAAPESSAEQESSAPQESSPADETGTAAEPESGVEPGVPENFAFAAVEGVKLSNKKEQTLTVSWKETSGAEGYRVRYSTSADMEKAKTKTTSNTSLTLKSLAVHQKYYVTVEAFASENGERVYGEPSTVRSKKITGKLICIDPGHQKKGNASKEPVGPGAKTLKKKTSDGTYGKWSKLNEYELNLTVALQLRKELQKRGYQVLMTRTTHNVNLSNIERAEIANKAKADLMIRIHADGGNSSSKRGAMTICCSKKNPYYAKKCYKKSKKLAKLVIKHFVKQTKSKQRPIWETDTMTGLNWSKVPAIILEMGYMSNPTEDKQMASKSYQKKMVKGIANGIDAYFK